MNLRLINMVDKCFLLLYFRLFSQFIKPEDRPQETDSYLPLYDETARIVTLGRLYHTDASITTAPTTISSSTSISSITSNSQRPTTSTNIASPTTDTTNTDTTSTYTYPYTNPYLTHEDEDYPEPGVLAGQLVFFNALSRADAIRYILHLLLFRQIEKLFVFL